MPYSQRTKQNTLCHDQTSVVKKLMKNLPGFSEHY